MYGLEAAYCNELNVSRRPTDVGGKSEKEG